jgi:hypothetical protein
MKSVLSARYSTPDANRVGGGSGPPNERSLRPIRCSWAFTADGRCAVLGCRAAAVRLCATCGCSSAGCARDCDVLGRRPAVLLCGPAGQGIPATSRGRLGGCRPTEVRESVDAVLSSVSAMSLSASARMVRLSARFP